MRHLALLLLFMVALLGAGDTEYLPGGGSGAPAVPGLVGTIGNELTLKHLMNLPSFQALPDLPKVYFSADANASCEPVLTGPNAGTCLPAGNDTTGNGTAELPYLTATKCESLMAYGHIHCIFDSLDAWDDPGDHTGDNTWSFSGTGCTDLDDACVVWSGSDRTGGDPAVFDCAAMFGLGVVSTGLFQDTRTTSGGYWAFENIELANCPETDTGTNQDIFRSTNSPGDILVMNVKLPNLNGSSNQYYTSHNTTQGGGRGQSEFTAINPYCHIPDWTNGANEVSQCIRSNGNSDVIVIGGEFSSSDDSASANSEVLIGLVGGQGAAPLNHTTVIGATLRNLNTANSGIGKQAIANVGTIDGEISTSAVMFSTFENFDGNAGDASIYAGTPPGIDTNTNSLYIYKNSFSTGAFAIRYVYQTATNTDTLAGACNAFDGQATSMVSVEQNCASLYVNVLNGVADETTPSNKYSITGTNYATSALFEAGSTAKTCRMASGATAWTFDTVADTTPFGTLLSLPYCRDDSCRNACTTPGAWTFPNNGQIPAFVAGARITGFQFSATSHIGR